MEGKAETAEVDGGGAGVAAAEVEAGEKRRKGRQVIRWERFLPRRSLRVLLVEYDDSTRHIVTALLRKCSYQVATVADGLKAWELLQERHFNFDLVLTEISMPTLSGIGLLTNVMGSEECKNIPVIMMSSQDSVGVVLKCMLKGAADFLVKPVRKNELRNLWQHVWRRHCSSSFAYASDNNAASNHVSVNDVDRSKTGENSDEENDEQSSSSKPELELAGVQKHAEHLLSERGQSTRGVEEKPEQPDHDMALGKEGREKSVGTAIETSPLNQEAPSANGSRCQKVSDEVRPSREEARGPVRLKEGDQDDPQSLSLQQIIDPSSQGEVTISSNVKNASDIGSSPIWELSLKRPLNGIVEQELNQRHIWNHSQASAFSRYGGKKIHASNHESGECGGQFQSQGSNPGINNGDPTSFSAQEKLVSPNVNIDTAAKVSQISSNSNKDDVGLFSSGLPSADGLVIQSSTGENASLRHPPLGFLSMPYPVGALPYQRLCTGYGAILQPVFYPESSLSLHGSASAENATMQIPYALSEQRVQVPCDRSGHHDNHYSIDQRSTDFHHVEENKQSYYQRQPIDPEPGEYGGLSCTPMEQPKQNGSCNQDIFNGSWSNGSRETADAAGNLANALESGNESGIQNCSRKGSDCDHSRREAALMKFRLKRKDRCFEKKVRYHSRQKLAEQRPRVKGQFVCQKISAPQI